jgi:hypothetical protein
MQRIVIEAVNKNCDEVSHINRLTVPAWEADMPSVIVGEHCSNLFRVRATKPIELQLGQFLEYACVNGGRR